MGTENGRPELRGLYTDPARPLTVAVGQVFDLVSMPASVGTAVLETLRTRRVRLGPVVADSRSRVMRVGFLMAPHPGTPTEDPGTAALREWIARLGTALGVRTGGRDTTATLPPLFPAWHGWLRWLVPPPDSGADRPWTPAAELLAVLNETLDIK